MPFSVSCDDEFIICFAQYLKLALVILEKVIFSFHKFQNSSVFYSQALELSQFFILTNFTTFPFSFQIWYRVFSYHRFRTPFFHSQALFRCHIALVAHFLWRQAEVAIYLNL